MPKQEPENELCRCCHTEGSFINMYASHTWMDVEDVVYSKLLQECFDIEMAPVTTPLQHMLCSICDTCIERLQDAMTFKRQVQKCEKRFRDVYGSCVGEERTFEVKVKQEVDVDFKDHSFNEANTSAEADTFKMMDDDDDDDDGFNDRNDDDDDSKSTGKDAVKVKKEVEDSDSEDDMCLTEVGKRKALTKTAPVAKKTKAASSKIKPDEPDDEELDVIQEGSEANRRMTRSGPAGNSNQTKKNPDSTEDEELVTIEENDSKETGKGAKRKKTKKTSTSVKKRSRKRSLKNSEPAEDDEELDTVDGISVIRVKIARARREIDYKVVEDKVQCLRCPEVAKSCYAIINHIRTVHFNTGKYRCPSCSDQFLTVAQLVKHKLDIHDIDQRFKCNACNKTFYEKCSLRHHVNGFHMIGQKLKCNECKFETFNMNSLRNHKIMHSEEKNHKCQYCQKAFKRRTSKVQHEKIHTGDKKKACAECGQAFIDRTSLKYHMTRHHPGAAF